MATPKEAFGTIPQSVTFRRGMISDLFYTSKPDQEAVSTPESIVLGELERQKLDKIIEVLNHPELLQLIKEGKITFGAIKPQAHDSKIGASSDEEAERILLSTIKPPLQPIFTIAVPLNRKDVDVFYKDVKPILEKTIIDEQTGQTAWNNYSRHMMSGPITYFLLYEHSGHAVEEWRGQMGATNPATAHAQSIRGMYARQIGKNLVHGSSGDTKHARVRNVRREVLWLAGKLETMREAMEIQEANNFLTEEGLRDIGVLTDQEQLIVGQRLFDFKQVAPETFIAAHCLTVRTQHGEIKQRYITEKAIYSAGGDSAAKAQDHYNRLQKLKDSGVNTPHIYRINGATIVEEYIPQTVAADVAISLVKNAKRKGTRLDLLSQFIKIATVLDKNGFIHHGPFYSGIVFDGKNLYFADTHFNLGEPDSSHPKNNALNQLLKTFKDPKHQSFIKLEYDQEYQKAKVL